jgi:hypothetical protein
MRIVYKTETSFMDQVVLEKLPVAQLVKELLVFYRTRVNTKDRYSTLVLSYRNLAHVLKPCFFKIRFSNVLPTKPESNKRSLPLRFSTKILYAFPIFTRATCPTHLVFEL